MQDNNRQPNPRFMCCEGDGLDMLVKGPYARPQSSAVSMSCDGYHVLPHLHRYRLDSLQFANDRKGTPPIGKVTPSLRHHLVFVGDGRLTSRLSLLEQWQD